MAIDISNKNEKQIALTGAEIEETLLQAHLSKAAIAKIEGLEVSASEIDNMVTNGATQADLDALALSTGNLTASQVATIDNLSGLEASASEIDDVVDNVLLKLDFVTGYYNINSFVVNTADTNFKYSASNPIDTTQDVIVTNACTNSSAIAAIVFTDKNGAYLGKAGNNTGETTVTVLSKDIPTGTYYASISKRSTQSTSYLFNLHLDSAYEKLRSDIDNVDGKFYDVSGNVLLSSFTGNVGYINYTTGAFVTQSNYRRTDEITLYSGDSIFVGDVFYIGSPVATIAVFVDGVYSQERSVKSVPKVGYTYTADVDCTIFICTDVVNKPKAYYISTKNILTKIDKIREEASVDIAESIAEAEASIKEDLNSLITTTTTNLTSTLDEITGYYIGYSKGTILVSSGYSCTQPIRLLAGDTITAKLGGATVTSLIAVYNADMEYQQVDSIVGVGNSELTYTFTATYDCFVRLTRDRGYTPNYTYTLKTLDRSGVEILNEKTDELTQKTVYLESLTEQFKDITFEKDINILLDFGQSLAVYGGSADTDAQYYGATYQLDTGLTQYTGANATSLIPVTNTGYETPVRAMGEQFLKQYISYKGLTDMTGAGFETVILAWGSGGLSVNTLYNNRTHLTRFIQNIADLAYAQGKNVCVSAAAWVQGEANELAADEGVAYKLAVSNFFAYLNEYVKENLGQEKDIQILLYQTASFQAVNNDDKRNMIPIVQYDIAKETDNCTLTTPMYNMPYNNDRTHVTRWGSRMMGAMFGFYAEKRVIENSRISGISHISSEIRPFGTKYIIHLNFSVPFPPLVVDTKDPTNTANEMVFLDMDLNAVTIPNIGFEIMSADYVYTTPTPTVTGWNSGINIESVEIVRGTDIKIVCDADPTGTELWYARRGNQGGGYVRDSMFDTENKSINIQGVEYPLNNWLPTIMVKL